MHGRKAPQGPQMTATESGDFPPLDRSNLTREKKPLALEGPPQGRRPLASQTKCGQRLQQPRRPHADSGHGVAGSNPRKSKGAPNNQKPEGGGFDRHARFVFLSERLSPTQLGRNTCFRGKRKRSETELISFRFRTRNTLHEMGVKQETGNETQCFPDWETHQFPSPARGLAGNEKRKQETQEGNDRGNSASETNVRSQQGNEKRSQKQLFPSLHQKHRINNRPKLPPRPRPPPPPPLSLSASVSVSLPQPRLLHDLHLGVASPLPVPVPVPVHAVVHEQVLVLVLVPPPLPLPPVRAQGPLFHVLLLLPVPLVLLLLLLLTGRKGEATSCRWILQTSTTAHCFRFPSSCFRVSVGVSEPANRSQPETGNGNGNALAETAQEWIVSATPEGLPGNAFLCGKHRFAEPVRKHRFLGPSRVGVSSELCSPSCARTPRTPLRRPKAEAEQRAKPFGNDPTRAFCGVC